MSWRFSPVRVLSEERNETGDRLPMDYTFWKDDEMWLGYSDAFPDYMTQGETVEELEENLIDIHETLTRYFNKTPGRSSARCRVPSRTNWPLALPDWPP